MSKIIDPWTYTSEDLLKDYYPLGTSTDLDPLLDRIGHSKYVLLGGASHGTHEFYTWRTEITKRLIKEKGFSLIAVEGDWPDCYKVNRWIKGYANTEDKISKELLAFTRWPTWLWANWETAALADWLFKYNTSYPVVKQVGFYGLDIFSLWESIDILTEYLKQEDPKTAQIAMQAARCFAPFKEDESYASIINPLNHNCKEEVVNLLNKIRKEVPQYNGDKEAGLNADMNALVASNGEKYYRAMISAGEQSWNIRSRHMMESLNALVKHHGPNAKTIIWAHNTHVGDARSTDMHRDGLYNLGQLVREQHEADGVVLVGFGTYEGTVIAADQWGAPMDKKNVPPAKENSIEELLHRESSENKLLIFDRKPKIKKYFNRKLSHRDIGVIYHPEKDPGNYKHIVLPSKYDVFIYLDKTSALHPIHLHPNGHVMPETYPFGF